YAVNLAPRSVDCTPSRAPAELDAARVRERSLCVLIGRGTHTVKPEQRRRRTAPIAALQRRRFLRRHAACSWARDEASPDRATRALRSGTDRAPLRFAGVGAGRRARADRGGFRRGCDGPCLSPGRESGLSRTGGELLAAVRSRASARAIRVSGKGD